ncbi:hypothetical protein NDU88_000267 [Pleurodeles waltl]|uniref:Uncharacterized protein n=1 Tax=Pleurodeles waltl TaxID=8319 RepID=A0AAV7SWI9_PLEWA|nr:hypothetical protein NDU88_000267 [Pleurodeles waltl]
MVGGVSYPGYGVGTPQGRGGSLIPRQHRDGDQYGAYDAGHYDQHMEERLVEAPNFHVQDSVVKALHPSAQPIFNSGIRRFGAGSGKPTPVEVNINEPGQSSSYDPLEQSINAILNDQEYEAFKSHESTPSFQTTLNTSGESNSSDLDDESTPNKTQGERKRKTHHAGDPLIPPQ